MNKKILVDLTYITQENIYASISIYSFRILDNIKPEHSGCYVLLIHPDMEEYIKGRYSHFRYIVFYYTHKYVQKYNYIKKHLVQLYQYRKTVNKSGCNVLLIASDQYIYTCAITKPNKIIVIHDLKALKEKSKTLAGYLRKKAIGFFYYLFTHTARKVIAISRYTKTDVMSLCGIKESKIEVIYNSIDLPSSSIKPQKITDMCNNYILYVNTLLPYKNIITLVKAFCKIKEYVDESLVIVGRPTEYWKNSILPIINENNIQNRVLLLEGLSNEELKYLYEKASLFVTTSLHEGFGYTPIEAAICYCPVISTKCEALADTTQGRLIYYDNPLDEEELSNRILETLRNKPSEEELKSISKCFKQAYSPSRQVEVLEHLFENC